MRVPLTPRLPGRRRRLLRQRVLTKIGPVVGWVTAVTVSKVEEADDLVVSLEFEPVDYIACASFCARRRAIEGSPRDPRTQHDHLDNFELFSAEFFLWWLPGL